MLNIIKADLYRIFRGKGVYITTIVFLSLILLQVLTGASGTVGVMVSDSTAPISQEVGTVLTGMKAPFEMMPGSDSLLYFVLPFIIFIAGADFSNGTAKNTLSGGTSRTKYYLAKLILSIVFATIILTLSIVLSMVGATLLNGFGGDFNLEYINSILKIFLPQLLMFIAVTCFGVFLVFTTKKVATTNSIYIAFLMIPIIVILILTNINPDLAFLMNYDVPLSIRALTSVDLASSDLYRIIGLGSFYILATTIGGLYLFKKCDIK